MKNQFFTVVLIVFFTINIYSQIPDYLVISYLNVEPNTIEEPTIIPQIVTPPNTPDIRIFPSDWNQYNISTAISPINDQILFASANTGYYFSTDGGVNWDGSNSAPPGCFSWGQPKVVIDRNGYFYTGYLSFDFGVEVMRSTDVGQTWTCYTVASGTGVLSTPLESNHLAVDNSISSPYTGYLYSAWADYTTSNGRITFARSINQGENWTIQAIISSGLAGPEYAHQGVNLQVDPYGVVYACWAVRDIAAPYTERGIGFNKSTDGGQTWGVPSYAINNIKGIREHPNPTLNIDTYSFPVMGVNYQNGKIHIAWINFGIPGDNIGDPDIYLITSSNDGGSWSDPVRVNKDPINNGAIQFHAWLSVDKKTGDIYVAFYDNRQNIGNNLCEFYLAKSSDFGQTFNDFAVSDNIFSVAPFSDTYFGTHPGLASYNGKIYPLWYSQNPSTYSQIWLSKVEYQLISVDQEREDGSRLTFSKFDRWNGIDFIENNILNDAATMSVEEETPEVLRGWQNPLGGPTEKYNHWAVDFGVDPDVRNHHNFSITADISNLTSQFKKTYGTVTLKNSLEGTNIDPVTDSVEFKDPWYIDFEDEDYGDEVRNRGMAEFVWRTRSSPFYPDFNTLFPNDPDPDQYYNGVFLDQSIVSGEPYYKVRVDQIEDIYLSYTNKTHKFYFQNWDYDPDKATLGNPNLNETAVVFKTSDADVSAIRKGTQLSNNEDAYTNPNQRKIIRSSTNHFHMVYESMGKVWYERSTDGATWEIMNGGEPLNDGLGKYPSIEYVPNYYYPNQFLIVFWEEIIEPYIDTRIIVQFFDNDNGGFQYEAVVASDDPYVDEDSAPVIARRYPTFLVAWDVGGNIAYRLGQLGSQINWDTQPTAVALGGDSFSKMHPTIGISQSGTGLGTYRLGWDNGTNIYVVNLEVFSTGTNPPYGVFEAGGYFWGQAGFSQNHHPSISVMPNNDFRISWFGENYLKGIGQKQIVTYFNNQFYIFGTSPSSHSMRVTDDGKSIIAFGDQNGTRNKFRQVWYWGNEISLNTTGRQTHLCNGSSINNMYAMSFQNNTVPHYFNMSSSLGSLNKVTEIPIASGRKGIVAGDSTEFYFTLGDVTLNGNIIDFISTGINPDFSNLDTLNYYLNTEEFRLKNSSDFSFSIQYGVTDSAKAAEELGENESVEFKLQLVKANNGQVIGEYTVVTFTKNNIVPFYTESFSINTNGIGNKDVRVRFVVEENIGGEYAMANINAEESILPKHNLKMISYNGSETVTEYSLSQNFPNPFNPSTTLKYQIPQNGFVTLKVYDILGKEVATLVNEEKASGRYEVYFNASSLASGVYLYRLTVNDYVDVKKMLLLK